MLCDDRDRYAGHLRDLSHISVHISVLIVIAKRLKAGKISPLDILHLAYVPHNRLPTHNIAIAAKKSLKYFLSRRSSCFWKFVQTHNKISNVYINAV